MCLVIPNLGRNKNRALRNKVLLIKESPSEGQMSFSLSFIQRKAEKSDSTLLNRNYGSISNIVVSLFYYAIRISKKYNQKSLQQITVLISLEN